MDTEKDKLRSKITELENTLHSIRSGEADSVLSPDGKIYTISPVETSFRYMIEKLSTGLAVLSDYGTIIYSNHRFAEILEINLSQVIDSKFVRFFNKDIALLIKENLEKGDLVSPSMEVTFQSKSVKNKHILITFSPLDLQTVTEFNRHFNKNTQFVITINDITDLKQLQTDYRKLSKDLEKKVRARTQELEELNRNLTASKRASLNLMEDAIETKNKIELINDQLNHEVTIRKDSELQTRKLNEELRKTIGELEISKEKAEESDRLKSAFLANMSHEIRTPMNGILGFTKLLAKPNLTGEERQQFIEIIKISSNRMLNTINDIIEISKIEAGDIEPTFSEININEQMDFYYNFFKPEAHERNIHLLVHKELPDVCARIKTDANMFNSILFNLIKNAIKFTDEGQIEFGYQIVDQQIKFFFKDTGIGIPKDKQEAIFNRFIQADITNQRAAQGSGLGLPITKAYIEVLGGEIWLESTENIGTSFYFTIPYNSTKNNSGPERPEVNLKIPSKLKDLKILIVEDDHTSFLHLSIILKKVAKEITHATTGVEAINQCKKQANLDLILMDIRMPNMNGYIATSKIREFNKEVVIIAQTANAMATDRDKAINSGCNDYISKPIEEENLFELLAKHLK